MVHGDVTGMCELVDLEGEPIGVACDEQDDDADQHDRRLFATFLKFKVTSTSLTLITTRPFFRYVEK